MKKMSLLLIALPVVFLAGCANPLMNAAAKGDFTQAEKLLSGGADVNAKSGYRYLTPLHYAAWNGQANMAALLIQKGANVNAVDTFRWTPLHWAAAHDRAEVVAVLLKNGADREMMTDKDNNERQPKTALMLAREKGFSKTSRMLSSAEGSFASSATAPHAAAVKSGVSSPVFRPSDLDDISPRTVKPNPKAYAILIGIEQYRQNLPSADFALQDARLVAEYLTKVMGYPEENVITLANDRAGLSDFVKYFEKWLPNNVEPGSSVFVYYSGHGAPNPRTGDAYLVPYDGDPAFIDETGYSLKRLYAALGNLPAKEVIVALDSCFSGAGGRSVLAKGARPIVLSVDNPVLLNKKITVLSASAGDQVSSTYDEKGHGLFTYFMLKGIKNEDVIRQDGSLDVASLFDYLKQQVSNIARKKYNNEQTPQLIGAAKK